MAFQPGTSGNPKGRPPKPEKLGPAVENAVSRHARTLVDLSIKRALAGDATALAGLMHVVAACINLREPKPKRGEPSPITDFPLAP
jgi:hypothetical protein